MRARNYDTGPYVVREGIAGATFAHCKSLEHAIDAADHGKRRSFGRSRPARAPAYIENTASHDIWQKANGIWSRQQPNLAAEAAQERHERIAP